MTTIEINEHWSQPYSLEPGKNIRIFHNKNRFAILLRDFGEKLHSDFEVEPVSDNPFIILLQDESNNLNQMKNPKILFRADNEETFMISFESWL
jgi:hypothetical protein